MLPVKNPTIGAGIEGVINAGLSCLGDRRASKAPKLGQRACQPHRQLAAVAFDVHSPRNTTTMMKIKNTAAAITPTT
jgi:hypothetical protein